MCKSLCRDVSCLVLVMDLNHIQSGDQNSMKLCNLVEQLLTSWSKSEEKIGVKNDSDISLLEGKKENLKSPCPCVYVRRKTGRTFSLFYMLVLVI